MSPRLAEPFTLEYALLGFLRDEPLHGYEIHQRLQSADELSRVWRLKQAHLYALLGKLEAAGLIAGELLPQDTRPPRRILHLTDAGRAAFEQWVRTPVQHGRDLRLEFLAKLFWAQRLGDDRAGALIDAQRIAGAQWLADLRRTATSVDENRRYEWLVIQFRLSQTTAMLHWLDTCEEVLLGPVTSR
jgi:PadR family transcriptional regulator AphA